MTAHPSGSAFEVADYAALRAAGWQRRQIASALTAGRLLRPRRDRYVAGDADLGVIAAVRNGARLDCVSLLERLGIFVLDRGRRLHLQFERSASHIAPPTAGIIRHWRPSAAPRTSAATTLVEALAQACRCQPPRAAIATLDNAWHQGLIDADGVAQVFAQLPARLQSLRPLLDPRSEAGTETLVRLLVRALGCSVEIQVVVDGVGRVDLVVDGWIAIECDSRAHHDGWEKHERDRRRDMLLAARGYASLRPTASTILGHPEEVIAAVRGLLTLGDLALTRAHGRRISP